MNDLHYAVAASAAHTCRVSVWAIAGEWAYQITLDGKVRDEGVLGPVDDDAWNLSI